MSVDRKSDVIVEVELPTNNDVNVVLWKNTDSKADKHTSSFYEGGEQTSPNASH